VKPPDAVVMGEAVIHYDEIVGAADDRRWRFSSAAGRQQRSDAAAGSSGGCLSPLTLSVSRSRSQARSSCFGSDRPRTTYPRRSSFSSWRARCRCGS